jgi:hypothetical protein
MERFKESWKENMEDVYARSNLLTGKDRRDCLEVGMLPLLAQLAITNASAHPMVKAQLWSYGNVEYHWNRAQMKHRDVNRPWGN